MNIRLGSIDDRRCSLLDLPRVEEPADQEDSVNRALSVSGENVIVAEDCLPDKDDMCDQEELEEHVTDRANGKNGSECESHKTNSSPLHPYMREVELLRKAEETVNMCTSDGSDHRTHPVAARVIAWIHKKRRHVRADARWRMFNYYHESACYHMSNVLTR